MAYFSNSYNQLFMMFCHLQAIFMCLVGYLKPLLLQAFFSKYKVGALSFSEIVKVFKVGGMCRGTLKSQYHS